RDRRHVTLYIAAPHSPGFLADIRASGRIAVVFTRPATHRTLQLKGDDARVRPLAAGETATVAAYVGLFAAELEPLGQSEDQARALFACADGDLVAIDFAPNAAFVQTPGPQAGTPVAVTR
ncbi:MAG: hypothetical protein ABI624_19110, partial [Casimicrobiaceae bacterium]